MIEFSVDMWQILLQSKALMEPWLLVLAHLKTNKTQKNR